MARMNSPSAVRDSTRCSAAHRRRGDPQRHRQAEQEAIAEREERRVVDGDDLAAGEQLRDAAAGHHEDERGDDGLHAGLDHQQPVPQAAGRGDAERGAERQPQRIVAGHLAAGAEAAADHERRHRRGDGDHGAHRDVEAAHRDHQRHAERHHDERRGAIQDVDEVAVQVAVAPGEREERRIEQGAHQRAAAPA